MKQIYENSRKLTVLVELKFYRLREGHIDRLKRQKIYGLLFWGRIILVSFYILKIHPNFESVFNRTVKGFL